MKVGPAGVPPPRKVQQVAAAPPPPNRRDQPPQPLPARGTAVWPARVGTQGVHHAHGRPICRVVGKPSCAPRAAYEPQDRPSNQIKSNPPVAPLPYQGTGTGTGGGGGLRAVYVHFGQETAVLWETQVMLTSATTLLTALEDALRFAILPSIMWHSSKKMGAIMFARLGGEAERTQCWG